MKARTLALTFSAAAVLVACDQPTNTCQAQRGLFSVYLTPKAGSGSCLGGQKVEFVNLQNYNPTAPGSSPPKRDVTVPPDLAIGTSTVGGLARFVEGNGIGDEDPNDKVYSIGKFTSVDPSSEQCSVPTLSPAHYVTGEIPPIVCGGTGGGGGGTAGGGGAGTGGDTGAGGDCTEDPGFPKLEYTVEWKNLQMVVRPDVPGTQFKAEVSYAIKTSVGGEVVDDCKDEYDAVGMYPGAVDCGEYDADGALCPEDGSGEGDCAGKDGVDIVACSPDPDPKNGRPFGSGINPDFPIICQRDDLMGGSFCVLDPAAGYPAIKKK